MENSQSDKVAELANRVALIEQQLGAVLMEISHWREQERRLDNKRQQALFAAANRTPREAAP